MISALQNFHYWLFTTGAGGALLVGVLIGLLVGCAVVGQTLFATTKDHLPEFATLRALGAPAGLIQQVILWQAAMSGVAGYLAGAALAGAGRRRDTGHGDEHRRDALDGRRAVFRHDRDVRCCRPRRHPQSQ